MVNIKQNEILPEKLSVLPKFDVYSMTDGFIIQVIPKEFVHLFAIIYRSSGSLLISDSEG
jgi:hypothetical protein